MTEPPSLRQWQSGLTNKDDKLSPSFSLSDSSPEDGRRGGESVYENHSFNEGKIGDREGGEFKVLKLLWLLGVKTSRSGGGELDMSS